MEECNYHWGKCFRKRGMYFSMRYSLGPWLVETVLLTDLMVNKLTSFGWVYTLMRGHNVLLSLISEKKHHR